MKAEEIQQLALEHYETAATDATTAIDAIIEAIDDEEIDELEDPVTPSYMSFDFTTAMRSIEQYLTSNAKDGNLDPKVATKPPEYLGPLKAEFDKFETPNKFSGEDDFVAPAVVEREAPEFIDHVDGQLDAGDVPVLNLDTLNYPSESEFRYRIPTAPSLADVVVPVFEPLGVVAEPNWTTPVFTEQSVDFGQDSTWVLERPSFDVLKGFATEQRVPDSLAFSHWNATTARELTTARMRTEEAARTFAAKGYHLPPGAMLAAERDINADAQMKLATASREIAAESAKLQVEERRMAANSAAALVESQSRFFVAQGNLILDAKKAEAEAVVALTNAMISKYNANITKFNLDISLYKTRMEAMLSRIEVYKASIEGAKIGVAVNEGRVNSYAAQVTAANGVIAAYRALVDTTKAKFDVERSKLDSFRARTEVLTAMVGAEKLKHDAFLASVQADTALVERYKAQIAAYATRIDAEMARVNGANAEKMAKLEVLKGMVVKYSTDSEVYGRMWEAERVRIAALTDAAGIGIKRAEIAASVLNNVQNANVSAFASESKTYADHARHLTEIAKFNIEMAKAKFETKLSASGLNVDRLTTAMTGWQRQVNALTAEIKP